MSKVQDAATADGSKPWFKIKVYSSILSYLIGKEHTDWQQDIGPTFANGQAKWNMASM
jgi:hypothetical protein